MWILSTYSTSQKGVNKQWYRISNKPTLRFYRLEFSLVVWIFFYYHHYYYHVFFRRCGSDGTKPHRGLAASSAGRRQHCTRGSTKLPVARHSLETNTWATGNKVVVNTRKSPSLDLPPQTVGFSWWTATGQAKPLENLWAKCRRGFNDT